jgi:hypothetical protein
MGYPMCRYGPPAALRECLHLRIETWGTRFCGHLNVSHTPRLDCCVIMEAFLNSHYRLEVQLRELKAARGALMRLEAESAANGVSDKRFIGAHSKIAAVEILKERLQNRGKGGSNL